MSATIEQLHAEVLPLVDDLQAAGVRGVNHLRKAPYRGLQWKHRAYQRDPFVIAFTLELPERFGTFIRRDELISLRRLVFHSDALNLDLVLRRRGSFRRPNNAIPIETEPDPTLFPCPEPKASEDARLAALIWDTPKIDKKHKAAGPTPIAVRLARAGHTLDDNKWESGFQLDASTEHELIPDRATYRHDMPDWDVESETETAT
ncbi:hypothetical protein CH276_15760 [Rhodococcus sp. 06-470-2]|uniref:hypothetical protein n=1 Tax=unclassified Rhodococcus (in: high G+C Gram-positive bacteria) TaxID=192944 RepID=UPI000B9C6578|nr:MULTISPECIES: hypothetical protein [unclassified Rhodococcus (in: high G+C Gram-positive bacteria)]OZC60797.1 hypothetical protein CH276_15760 [Rhodococcus sp. 06-470-2]OZE64150.1 hypothetical protein CH265_10400 [Rhodococcus sp. 05-2221-1B]